MRSVAHAIGIEVSSLTKSATMQKLFDDPLIVAIDPFPLPTTGGTTFDHMSAFLAIIFPAAADFRHAIWKMSLTEEDISILFTMVGGHVSITVSDEKLKAVLATPSTISLLPVHDYFASKQSMFLAIANKGVVVETLATKWMKFATVDALQPIALNLGITAFGISHADLAHAIFTHSRFATCKEPMTVGATKEVRLSYLHSLSLPTAPTAVASPPPLQPPATDLSNIAAQLASTTSRSAQRNILEAQLAKLGGSKKRGRTPADSSSDDDDDDVSRFGNKGSNFISDFSTYNLHDEDSKSLSKGEFVPLAALHTGKGHQSSKKRSQQTLVIPDSSHAASAVLTIAAKIVCQRDSCTGWSDDCFTYIQFIVSLFTFLSAAGVHEVDRLCRSYCCVHDIAWCVPPEIYHHIMCVMVATSLAHIVCCTICGNKDCSADRCHYQQLNSSSGSSPVKTAGTPQKREPPYKQGHCKDFNRASGCKRNACKFIHKCSAKNCSKAHPFHGNH